MFLSFFEDFFKVFEFFWGVFGFWSLKFWGPDKNMFLISGPNGFLRPPPTLQKKGLVLAPPPSPKKKVQRKIGAEIDCFPRRGGVRSKKSLLPAVLRSFVSTWDPCLGFRRGRGAK